MKFYLVALVFIIVNLSLKAQSYVLDEFNTKSYSENNGNKDWIDYWVEQRDDKVGKGEKIFISNNRLRLRELKHNEQSIKRAVNLSNASAATLSFEWQANFKLPKNKNKKKKKPKPVKGKRELTIQISTNNSSNFIDLGVVSGNQTGDFVIDISKYISPHTVIRFINSGNSKDDNWKKDDYVDLDNIKISYEESVPPYVSGYSNNNLCSNVRHETSLLGQNLGGVSSVLIGGVDVRILSVSSLELSIEIPIGFSGGDLNLAGSNGSFVSDNLLIMIDIPSKPQNIDGAKFASQGDTKSYICDIVDSSYSYEWNLSGGNEEIINRDNQGDVVFLDNSIPGYRDVSVRAINKCGSSEFSDLYSVFLQSIYSCTSTLVNWNFDEPALNGSDWRGYRTVNGWQSSLNNIEIWRNGFFGIQSYDGGQFCELNSIGRNEMWQNISTTPGAVMRWEITYRYRDSSSEQIMLQIGSDGNLADIERISNSNNQWITYSGNYTVPEGQFITQFRIKAMSEGSSGNLIDNIQFYSLEADLEPPMFDCPTGVDTDGVLKVYCGDISGVDVFDIGLVNISDNCTKLEDLIIEYRITTENGDILHDYEDISSSDFNYGDASGFLFTVGNNILSNLNIH